MKKILVTTLGNVDWENMTSQPSDKPEKLYTNEVYVSEFKNNKTYLAIPTRFDRKTTASGSIYEDH